MNVVSCWNGKPLKMNGSILAVIIHIAQFKWLSFYQSPYTRQLKLQQFCFKSHGRNPYTEIKNHFCFFAVLRFVIPLRMYNSWILPSLPLPNDGATLCNCSSVCRLLTLKSSCFCFAPDFTFVHAVSHFFLHRLSEKTQDFPNKNAGCLLKKNLYSLLQGILL